MSTATAEPQTETVTFMSRSPNQVLTRRAVRTVSDGMGGKTILTEDEWLQREEELNAQREADNREVQPIDRTPWKVEFSNHMFSTDNAQLIEWLRNHPTFNMPGPSGFYEQGAAPDEPKPTMTEQMTEIADAGAAGDIERLRAALKLEEDTHERPPIIASAEAGIARLEEYAEPASDADLTSEEPPSTSER